MHVLKKQILIPYIAILLMSILGIPSISAQESQHINKFAKILRLINYNYVDSVEEEHLVETAIVEMLKELDPHSIYLTKEDQEESNEQLRGNFVGIGITYNIYRDTLLVISPMKGGPSERVGIKPGDRIIEIESENIAGVNITNKDIQEKLRGKRNTPVRLGVMRPGEKKKLLFSVLRDKIPLYSIDASYMIEDDIGYIKLKRFAASTMSEFDRAMTALRKQGLNHLVLDLRDNSGGYLRVAKNLVDEFMDEERLIVYTEGNHSKKYEYKSSGKGDFHHGKLVILIDEGSASASEIVSGAVQDWDRGIIVGRRSFGKGLVQRSWDMSDGSAIRLTTARYYTPTGRLIQKPYKNGVDEYSNELEQRFLNGELTNLDSIHFPDSLKFYTLLKRREVYGGGGIMPDIFVPVDTSKYSEFYKEIIQSGTINNYVIHFIESRRAHLAKMYPDFDSFKENFEVDEDIFADFEDYVGKHASGERNSLEKETNDVDKYEEKEFADKQLEIAQTLNEHEKQDLLTSKDEIIVQLKALIARDLWNTNEYFQVYNQINPSFLKALEVIRNPNMYNDLLANKNSN